MNDIAIFGGTFNPVHLGHMHLVKSVLSYKKFDKVIIIPSNLPPHKTAEGLISNRHRYNMLELAFRNVAETEISKLEFDRPGVSYTIDTLEELKKIYKNTNIFLIIGSDMLLSFELWKDYAEILKIAHIICVARELKGADKLSVAAMKLGNATVLKVPAFPVSSAMIRQKIKSGEDFKKYLDPKVYDYIMKHKLYM